MDTLIQFVKRGIAAQAAVDEIIPREPQELARVLTPDERVEIVSGAFALYLAEEGKQREEGLDLMALYIARVQTTLGLANVRVHEGDAR
jgi:hypothetical protein